MNQLIGVVIGFFVWNAGLFICVSGMFSAISTMSMMALGISDQRVSSYIVDGKQYPIKIMSSAVWNAEIVDGSENKYTITLVSQRFSEQN